MESDSTTCISRCRPASTWLSVRGHQEFGVALSPSAAAALQPPHPRINWSASACPYRVVWRCTLSLSAPSPPYPAHRAAPSHTIPCRTFPHFAVLCRAVRSCVLQIIIFCCAHADQIQEHLADSKWLKQKAPRVLTVTSTNCFSLGEAMRSLDQRDIVKGTFILVTGVTRGCDMGVTWATWARQGHVAVETVILSSMRTSGFVGPSWMTGL